MTKVNKLFNPSAVTVFLKVNDREQGEGEKG